MLKRLRNDKGVKRYIDTMDDRVSYRGGGTLGYPPPRSSFPPPRISYHNVIMNQIENCTSCNYPKCIRINLRECKDQKFSGGACPQTPLVCRASTKHGFPPPSLKSCMKPWMIYSNYCARTVGVENMILKAI